MFASPFFSYSFGPYSMFMAVILISLNYILLEKLMLYFWKKNYRFFIVSSILSCSDIVANIYLFLCLFCKDSRLNNNSLVGQIPESLTNISTLQVL